MYKYMEAKGWLAFGGKECEGKSDERKGDNLMIMNSDTSTIEV